MRSRWKIRMDSGRACAFLACAGIWACMQNAESPPPPMGASLRLALAPAAWAKPGIASGPALDSAEIRISGEDMPLLVFRRGAPLGGGRGGDSLAITLDSLPPGENRLVSAWLYRNGRALYAGKGLFSFRSEARLEASLRCDPLFSRVVSRFHLPMGLASPLRGGRLDLKGAGGVFSADLRIQDEFGSFLVDEVPGDQRYDVSMVLYDSGGTERYRAERTGMFLPLGEAAEWNLSLSPTEASAGLSLRLEAPKEAQIRWGIPGLRRAPSRPEEIVIAGFYAAPAEKDSGSQGEWFCLFNRGADTLSLGGCRFSRDRGAGATRAYPFPPDARLLPGASLSFGRPASRAAFLYPEFSLPNTAASLLLLCAGDSLVVDSVRYSSSSADSVSALPMKEGWVTRLSGGALGRHNRTSAWCLARPEAGPPGELRECGP